ncbi:MAG TPA: 2OG-Fe(II) oxygenase family protein [Sphingomicrobium sp.]|nr:2OG-Fe(II) oxygenase family protein [Sphingomicrobium sp.]
MAIELNPSLDLTKLASDYGQTRRMQIRNFLTDRSAHAVLEDLHELPWGLAYNDGPTVHQVSPDRVAAMTDREGSQIMAGIQARARTQYQFLYAFFPTLAAYISPTSPRFRIFEFFEFINSEPVLQFIRRLTGLDEIRWADAQATWYRPGHFLKGHTDEDPSTGRVAAYIMNFSKDWERDWGGFLQFFDSNDNIEQAFKPSFNTLNIFTIPQLHSVSMVSTYVQAERLAVTGWFRNDDPPAPIGKA